MARSRLRTVRSAYDRCAELFAAYPLAVQCADWAGTLYSMVLIVVSEEGEDVRFENTVSPKDGLVPLDNLLISRRAQYKVSKLGGGYQSRVLRASR